MADESLEIAGSDPTLIGGRYEVLGLLGRGGMASAYRVRDRSHGMELALKQLKVKGDASRAIELFEKEFHTLVQLQHPRVVRVYDYGRDGDNPYYTMELLDGGDIRALAPLPWQEACSMAYEVCSALSLLHSRRLVHRDLTPTNVRLSADGKAKLIDFGLIGPFGPSEIVAGTPPFVAPELIHQLSLDGRSDLFTFGATLYFALTGRLAFPARHMGQLRDLWRNSPVSPSRFAPDIPPALDALVASLLRIDAGSRPKSAAEVMARLRPMLAEPPAADLEAAAGYLTAPTLVGQEDALMRIRKQVIRSVRGRGGGFVVSGAAGTGRSRLLDAFVLEAKLMGATTARADRSAAASGPLGVARALVAQLHAAAPLQSMATARRHPAVHQLLFGEARGADDIGLPLLDIARPGPGRADVQRALRTWFEAIADSELVALAVDDFDQADEPSAALLASLALGAAKRRLVYCVATPQPRGGGNAGPLSVLEAEAHLLALSPLSAAQTGQLLLSVFGDVQHLRALSTSLHGLGGGLPREVLALAQRLVDGNIVTYDGGTWSLPSTIDPAQLPSNTKEARAQLIQGLPSHTRSVGQLLALSVVEGLTRAQLVSSDGLEAKYVDDAIDTLQRLQLLVGSPSGYQLRGHDVPQLFTEGAQSGALELLHEQLGAIAEAAQESGIVIAYHRLQGADPSAALEALLALSTKANPRGALQGAQDRISGALIAETLELGYALDLTKGSGPANRCLLWPMLAGIAALGQNPKYYHRVAASWLAQLKQDSGFDDWRLLTDESDPATRAFKALGAAQERYQATPESARGYAPGEAIKEMVAYVVCSIAIAARTLDYRMNDELAELLIPFETLSPLVVAIRIDADAAYAAGRGQRDRSRGLFRSLTVALDGIKGGIDATFVRIQAAVWQAIALSETTLGMESDVLARTDWVSDPSQAVGAEYIRMIAALHCGDWEGAEHHRRSAELNALETQAGSMFSALSEELDVHAWSRDVSAVRAVRARLAEQAQRMPGWRCVLVLADAHLRHLTGEFEQALQVIEAGRAATPAKERTSRYLLEYSVVEVDALLALGRSEEALQCGLAALEAANDKGRAHVARLVSGGVAIAEATLGAPIQATQRMERVLEQQRALGVRGLLLGRTHEHLARIAILAEDKPAYQQAAAEAAQAYGVGSGSVLGALYERLVEDARRSGLLGVDDISVIVDEHTSALLSHIQTSLVLCMDDGARAQAGLALLCERETERAGHLFLLIEEGLVLCASTSPLADETALALFAQQQLELELDDGSCTVTGGLSSIEGDGALNARVSDTDGTSYLAQPLLAVLDGEYLVVGVALLAVDDRTSSDLSVVAGAVAKHLLESGAYKPLRAA